MTKDIFSKNVMECIIQLNPTEYNCGIDESLLEKLKNKVEGKCDSYGYIKNDSARIIKRSIGILSQCDFRGLAEYRIVYSVDICNPVEGMVVNCVVKNINKMGLFCSCADYDPSPLSFILAKQHHLKDEKFELVKINDIIKVEIIGVKFNYNDTNISCIGKLRTNNFSMEEELDNEPHIEIEIPDNTESEDEEPNFETGEEDEEDTEDEALVQGKSKQIEDIVLDKYLQKEDNAVLGEMKSGESLVNDIEELPESLDIMNMEGVQDLESVDLESKSTQGALKTEVAGELDDLDMLGEEFEGEQLNLDDISRKDLVPVYNEESLENPEKKPDKDVFKLEVLSSKKYKTFSKPRKNSTKHLNYLIYVQLNNMMIKFFNQNEVEPKKVFINKNHMYLKQMKEYLSKMGKSLQVEETDGLSYVL